jgi:transposase
LVDGGGVAMTAMLPDRGDKLRAQIVLDAAAGYPNAVIAARRHVHVDTVRKWRGRFAGEGLAGLADRPRSGRPTRFTPVQQAEVKALACQLPAETDVPLARWSCPELACEAVNRRVVATISPTTIRGWLAEDAIKPWQHQSWIFIRDPLFQTKAARVLDLYQRIGTANASVPTSTSSAPMRSRPSRPAAAATGPCHQARPAPCGSSTSTTAPAQ